MHRAIFYFAMKPTPNQFPINLSLYAKTSHWVALVKVEYIHGVSQLLKQSDWAQIQDFK